MLDDCHPRDFEIRLWNGSQLPAETSSPHFTLVLKHPDALRSMLQDTTTDLSIAEAYICGKLDVKGDLEAAMRARKIAMLGHGTADGVFWEVRQRIWAYASLLQP
jgi:hypothetical protein